MLVLHTGWDAHWGTDAYFDHPFLDGDAAERVVAAGVRTVGLDALSLDETVLGGEPAAGFAAHFAVLGAGRRDRREPDDLDAVARPTRWSACCRCGSPAPTGRRCGRSRSTSGSRFTQPAPGTTQRARPWRTNPLVERRAACRNRTDDLLITSEMLYRLS